MAWFNHSRQDVLPLDRENYGVSENVHGSRRRPGVGESFQRTIDQRSYLGYTAKLMTRKMEILNNPNTSATFKKQTIKQLDPDIELYVRKLRQLPAAFSAGADPTKLAEALKDE